MITIDVFDLLFDAAIFVASWTAAAGLYALGCWATGVPLRGPAWQPIELPEKYVGQRRSGAHR